MKTIHTRQSGSTLLVAVMASIVIVGLAFAMSTISMATRREYADAHLHLERLYVAEGGVSLAMLDMTHGGSGDIGSPTSPANRNPLSGP